MKQIITALSIIIACITLQSCNEYIDILPKGTKIPKTLADYEPLLRDEYTCCQAPVANALYLMNDRFVGVSNLNSNDLRRANYMWDESADRILLNNADEAFYYNLYSGISTYNLIIENVPSATECTDAERNEVIAYARVLRAYNYLMLVNYYADTYQESTASQKLGVPMILSANIDAPHSQPTVAKIYGFIISEIEDVLKSNTLPEKAMTILHPDRGAAHAILARTYLMMGRYTDALSEAELALTAKNELFDWNSYYDEHRSIIETENDYTQYGTPLNHSYIESYFHRAGDNSPNYTTSEQTMPVERGLKFEAGDAMFMSRWKKRTVNLDTYYYGMGKGYFNLGGMTTVEVYLIKAECLARDGKIDDAMNTLNTVRKTRIRPDVYKPVSAKDLRQAIELIRRTKDDNLVMTLVPFMDARRFNAEGTYATTFNKTYDNKSYTLKPDSHLWTMVFPAGAVNNPGKGTIAQNSK